MDCLDHLNLIQLLTQLSLNIPFCYLFSLCPVCSLFLSPSFFATFWINGVFFMILFYLHYHQFITVYLQILPNFTYTLKTLQSILQFLPLVLCVIVVIYFISTYVTNPQYSVILFVLSNQLCFKKFKKREVFYVYVCIYHFLNFLFLYVDLNFHLPSA